MNKKQIRRGLVLILVLLVVAMLSLGAYSFTNLMLAHHEAAQLAAKQAQARALVDSGVEFIRTFLAMPAEDQQEEGGIFDNTKRFRGVVLRDDDDVNQRGLFSVVSPNIDESGNLSGVRHGLEDESTRLNMNVLLILDQQQPGAGRTLLMALPEMTEEIADAILDFIDPDDDSRDYGAEIDYYSSLDPPYAPKNGPIETVEELLKVKGVTPQLLFGSDINRNGSLDDHEASDVEGSGGSTDQAGFRGWSAFLTLYSMEWNVTPDGQPKIYLNTNDLNKLHDDLASAQFDEDWITFIIAYRQMGPMQAPQTIGGVSSGTGGLTGSTGGATAAGNSPATPPPSSSQAVTLNMDLQPQTPIGSVLDLVGSQVQYTVQGQLAPVTLSSPLNQDSPAEDLAQLLDWVTVNPAATIPGRISINQASASVLSGIPSITPDIVQQIIDKRNVGDPSDPNRRSETWIMAEKIVTLDQMKVLMPFINAGGSVYRAQVVGYFQSGQASSRAEAVFDATSPLPRIVFWRDLSHLGRGYSIDTLGTNYAR